MSRKRLIFAGLGVTALAAAAFAAAALAPLPAAETPGPGEPSLAEVRRATERFRDVRVALAEGYIRRELLISF